MLVAKTRLAGVSCDAEDAVDGKDLPGILPLTPGIPETLACGSTGIASPAAIGTVFLCLVWCFDKDIPARARRRRFPAAK